MAVESRGSGATKPFQRHVLLLPAALFILLAGVAPSLEMLDGAARAATPNDDGIHLGVASCAGSTCHGSVEPWKSSPVRQNEYLTWQRKDKHAKAYEVLLNDRSKRIALNLGLGEAHKAKACLDCHADNVPPERRGPNFHIADGVGCEACHGGSVRWIGVHLTGRGHDVNVANGMYPTDDPTARAKLCLSCHLGDETRFVTHRMMGAGHPRMAFELDTFTLLQPAHFEADEDYAKRRKLRSGVQAWAIGQALAIQRTLELLVTPGRGRDGVFPELVFFDCHACHHPMSNLRWQPRQGTALQPGMVRFNDANLVMLRVIARHVDKPLGDALLQQTLALHAASTVGHEAMVDAAKALRLTAEKLAQAFAKRDFGPADSQALLAGVIDEGLAGEYADYAAAEQATMALGSLLDAVGKAGLIDKGQTQAMKAALAQAYKAVDKDDEYRPGAFVDALKKFKATVPKF